MLLKTILALLLPCLAASASPPAVQRDLPYAGTDNPFQRLDVYPLPGVHHPVVVWIHGGGWASGDKGEDMEIKPQAFAGHGCVLISANYRLLTKPGAGLGGAAVGLRDMEADLAKAVRWVRDHAEPFGGDPNFIVITGHSAGAQLAALLCTDETYLEREGVPLTALRGCVPIDGDTYYPALQVDTNPPRRAEGYRRKFPDAAAQRDLSAVAHVAPGKGIPPFLLLHVTDFPETHTLIQAAILAQSLTEAGVPVRDFGARGRTHLTINTDLGAQGDEATRAMFEFIDAQLWKADYASWSRSVKLPSPPSPDAPGAPQSAR